MERCDERRHPDPKRGTARGSHFCRTAKAAQAPAEEQNGQITQALRALGIRQILARSPQARGRSERVFGTIKGRLPQELRVAGITSYGAANGYIEDVFVPDFNCRFPSACTSFAARCWSTNFRTEPWP